MADDEDVAGGSGYTWESEYEKTWEVLQEDSGGSIQASVDHIILQAKRKRLLERPVNVRLGMMRHMYIVLDMSQYMLQQDMKPTRQLATCKVLENFVEEYFDQNPISQIGLVITRNKKAEKFTELGGNPRRHMQALREARDLVCSGEPSLQNILILCKDTLKHMPSHTSKEVLIVYGSLTTCDSSNIYETIEDLKQAGIRCSVVALSAELHICKILAKETGGTHSVMLNEAHLRDLLLYHISPPAAGHHTDTSLIKMGFPAHLDPLQEREGPSLCVCHLDKDCVHEKLGAVGYLCPQCGSKYCELPVECGICGLILVSAPHLARSYHHLFPLPAFTEISNQDHQYKSCSSCVKVVSIDESMYRCGECEGVYCVDCDLFIHETLHSCPGCVNQ